MTAQPVVLGLLAAATVGLGLEGDGIAERRASNPACSAAKAPEASPSRSIGHQTSGGGAPTLPLTAQQGLSAGVGISVGSGVAPGSSAGGAGMAKGVGSGAGAAPEPPPRPCPTP